ncbi:MAG: DedA family protein [Burkholderiales bacterium]|nr:DedA family protein [Burkholderiales bacterium]
MAEWVVSFIQSNGVPAVALLMFLENVFPPIPSELIMPFAGFAAAKGDMNIVMVALAGALGSVAGAVFWYWVGRRFGVERVQRWAADHGTYLAMSSDDVGRAEAWFKRKGTVAVFIGRLVPAVRTLISVPAGMVAMSLPKFLLWSFAGSLLWSSLLAGLGFLLGEKFEDATRWLDIATKVILACLFVAYVWRVVKLRRSRT